MDRPKSEVIYHLSLLIIAFFGCIGLAVICAVSNPLQTGVYGTYYPNQDWTAPPFMTTRDLRIDLRRLAQAYPERTSGYSIAWQGWLCAPEIGAYQFEIRANDQAEIVLGDQQVVEHRGQSGTNTIQGTITLKQACYPLTVRFRQGQDIAEFEAFWQPPNHPRRPLSDAPIFLEAPTSRALVIGLIMRWLVPVWLAASVVCLAVIAAIVFKSRRYFITWLPEMWIDGLLFVVILLVYVLGCKVSTSLDSKWAIYTAMSIIKDGDANLDEYRQRLEEEDYRGARVVEPHFYDGYPIGTSLLSLPYVAVLDHFYKRTVGIELQNLISATSPRGLEILIASTYVALTTIMLYAIGKMITKSAWYAWSLAFIFAFCTSAWSTASRALWQHGPTALMLSVVLWLLLTAQQHPRYAPALIGLAGIPLTYSFLIRPTNLFSILFLTLYIVLRHRNAIFLYFLGSLTVALPFVVSNQTLYHTWFPAYYTSSNQLHLNIEILKGLAGTLISPSRGLFIFSPVLLFAVYGVYRKIRQKQMTLFDYALVAILFCHWGITASHPHWWGGHSYGPRYFVDMLPYVLYFLIPALTAIPEMRGLKKRCFVGLLAYAIVISFFIHFRGATAWDGHYWNSEPVNVDDDPSRVWDWRDMQFLRGFGQ